MAVIGAGASGLAASRALREIGIAPTVFEAAPAAGGLWRYAESGPGPAYRSLRTNTSKQITAFSDLPFAADLPDFPGRAAVEDYLCGYARRLDLLPLIRHGCAVETVRPTAGGWQVCVAGEAPEEFHAVVVCSGIFRRGVLPSVPGLPGFRGAALHSLDYRRPEPFADRDVLVVGLGSSAADIALDLAGTASRVSLSVRRGAWIAPRMVAGRPLDHRGTRLSLLLPERTRAARRRRLLLAEYARRALPPPADIWARAGVQFDAATAPSVTSDDLLPRILAGAIAIRPQIARIAGREVFFADGSSAHPEVVIFCTGYELDFPFLSPELAPWRGEAGTGLFRLVFPARHPSLAFVGVCRAHGPILPIVEMQARWAARVLAGETPLPSPSAMRREIELRLHRQAARHDSPLRVALLPYLDELAAEIGARPRLMRHPDLLRPLLTGPPVAAQYRLNGPNTWSGATDAIRAAARR